ncbi:PLP-dependent aminotransferase family protein [uncultured Draconibacterium sp.]|uniref:aminotransferase-like domain-containing protein n=1 Tax=uncultured Draconibacterium sp. TaxID=1573823 RepID=UPI002AA8A8A8|nr:PLP-dependent aminotransferase family protein [uncultured Draconibacterium sp.]
MEKPSFEKKLSENYRNIPPSFVRSILNVAENNQFISFAGGLPNPDLFPANEIRKSANAVLQESAGNILQYAGSMGYYPLRQWIAKRYADKYDMKISPEQIIITNGSQQAIDILARLFINQGDGVVIEKPSYLGAIQALSAYRPQFCEVDLEEDGANLSQVEDWFWKEDVKLMYAVPNAQNPSGISYSDAKRKHLAELLKCYDKFLIEDDPYNEIYFENNFPAPVKKYANNNVAWTGSFSKMIAPGLRNGWVILPDELVPHFDKAKQSTDLNPNNLTQFVIHHYLTNNDLEKHLQSVRKKYHEQYKAMQDAINHFFPDDVYSTTPSGGMFIWLTLPAGVSSVDLVQETMKRGVVFVPGNSFYTEGSGQEHIRLNFSNAQLPAIEKGIKIIASELEKMMVSIC